MIPAGAAGSLRIRSDDLDSGLDQVFPGFDVFRVALADQEDDGGGVRRTVFRQAFLPILRNQSAPGAGDGVDVVGERQRHHVGGDAVDHGPRLLSGTAVGLADHHILPGLLFPVFPELFVVGAIKFAGGIIRNVEQFHFFGGGDGCSQPQQETGQRFSKNLFYGVVHIEVSLSIPTVLLLSYHDSFHNPLRVSRNATPFHNLNYSSRVYRLKKKQSQTIPF
ncbi:hypothetical protein SDC9_153703 [bioreactor metagenome]|uniref:Uncharacterized protein n=1 Tax=bioreactor metagenome TaxID=1076179 RepID=A0A645EX27_9ZZZZ